MQVKIERVGDLMLTVKENHGEKFYSFEDVLEQTGITPCALDAEQKTLMLNCKVIFGYRFDGTNFLQSVFVDEAGLKNLTKSNQ